MYGEEVRRYFLSIYYVSGNILGSCVQNEFLLYLGYILFLEIDSKPINVHNNVQQY